MTQVFQFKAGATFRADFQRFGLDDQPLDLTDVAVASQIRMMSGRSAGWSASLEIIPVDLARGRFAVSAAPEVTASWPVGSGVWDIRFGNGEAAEFVPAFGVFTVEIEQAATWVR